MTSEHVIEIGRDLLATAIWMAGPAVLISLFVGLAISLLQTVTSVQEQTLSFAPRIAAVAVTLVITLPWMIQACTSFTLRMVDRMLEAAQ